MKIFVQAKPADKEEKVEEIDSTTFKISVREPPLQGRANAALIQAVANHFNVPASRVRILMGHTSRHKVIEIV